jgi:hypothetical protein
LCLPCWFLGGQPGLWGGDATNGLPRLLPD